MGKVYKKFQPKVLKVKKKVLKNVMKKKVKAPNVFKPQSRFHTVRMPYKDE